MPQVSTGYGPGGVQNVSLGREGLDIGSTPNFWGDLYNTVRFLRPLGRGYGGYGGGGGASGQAEALRAAQPYSSEGRPEGSRPARGSEEPSYDYEPNFGTLTYPMGSAGFYQGYSPGMPMGTGQAPIAMGYTQRRIG